MLLILLIFLPLLGSVVSGLFGFYIGRIGSVIITTLTTFLSFLFSLFILYNSILYKYEYMYLELHFLWGLTCAKIGFGPTIERQIALNDTWE